MAKKQRYGPLLRPLQSLKGTGAHAFEPRARMRPWVGRSSGSGVIVAIPILSGSRGVQAVGRILCLPILGGLHHQYVRN
jgi:hypothetical protein